MCVTPPHGAAGNPLDSPSPSATDPVWRAKFAGAATAIIWPRCACEPGPWRKKQQKGLSVWLAGERSGGEVKNGVSCLLDVVDRLWTAAYQCILCIF
jgi:hypothetical protein